MELGYISTLTTNLGGFNYDNCLRNTALLAQTKGENPIKHMKTGTTICGVLFNVSDQTCKLTKLGRSCAGR